MTQNKKTIYMDYASATPLDERVLAAMEPYWSKIFANPNALHKAGLEAQNAVAKSRLQTAKVLGAHADEIFFTSGGTESDNLTVLGVINAYKKTREYIEEKKQPHVVVSSIEHSAILETAKYLESEGVDVTYISVNEKGLIDPKDVAEALREETVLVSVMYANNEVGTVQPVREIAKVIRHFKKTTRGIPGFVSRSVYPYFHTDAVQALQYLDVNVEKLGVDLLSINASKIYGPKGVGALYVRRGAKLLGVMHGGEQESGLRPGTLPTPLVVGLGAALEIAEEMREVETARLKELQKYFIESLRANFKNISINGDEAERLPNNVHIAMSGMDSELLLFELDARGIFVSAKSACKSHDALASYVIMNMRKDYKLAEFEDTAFIRFSMGRGTNRGDVDEVINSLRDISEKYAKAPKVQN